MNIKHEQGGVRRILMRDVKIYKMEFRMRNGLKEQLGIWNLKKKFQLVDGANKCKVKRFIMQLLKCLTVNKLRENLNKRNVHTIIFTKAINAFSALKNITIFWLFFTVIFFSFFDLRFSVPVWVTDIYNSYILRRIDKRWEGVRFGRNIVFNTKRVQSEKIFGIRK